MSGPRQPPEVDGFKYDIMRDEWSVSPEHLRNRISSMDLRLSVLEKHFPTACPKCGEIKGTIKTVMEKEPILYRVCHRCDKVTA